MIAVLDVLLVAIPIMLMVFASIMAVWGSLGVVGILLGAFLLAALVQLLRYEWRSAEKKAEAEVYIGLRAGNLSSK